MRISILICSALVFTPSARAVTLAAEGQPNATIVLPEDAGDTLTLAAQELQTHILAMSGAELPIVSENNVGEGVTVLLDLAQTTDVMGQVLSDRDIGYDGYVIKSSEATLSITGRKDAGTLNGVYGFLEDHLGVRWYYPGPMGTHVPQTATVTVGDIDEVNKPRFAVRRAWYNSNCTAGYTDQEMQEYRVWVRRNRSGGPSGYVGHHWARSVSPGRYFDDHPEYFAELQGTRRPLQLCTTNADVVDIYAKDIIGRFDADPEFLYASMSPNDGAGWCECSPCVAVSDDLTSRIVTFINQVAQRVGEEHPDRQVAFYAYAGIVAPPADDIQLEANAVPWLAHYSTCQLHALSDPTCPYQTIYRRKVEGWKAIAEEIGVREYASWWPVPCAEARRLAMDTRYYASIGARAMSREYLEVQYGTPLLMWLEHKLLWNPDQESRELLADFFSHFYGPAGDDMSEVYATLSGTQASAAPPQSNWTGNAFEAPRIYPAEMLQEMAQKVTTAEAEMDEGTHRDRVHRERLALEHAVLWLAAWTADRNYAKTASDEDKQDALQRLAALVAFRDNMPDSHVVSAVQRGWASRQIELYTTDRTLITEAGDWSYEDSFNAGGMVRQDAEEFSGFSTGTWTLSLLAGGEGHVQYHFSTQGDLRFTDAELYRVLLACPDGVSNRIEVQRDDGDWQLISEDRDYPDRDHVYSLKQHVAGAREFRVRIWARNGTADRATIMDNLGIRGKAE